MAGAAADRIAIQPDRAEQKPWRPQTWQDLTRISRLDFSLLSPDFRGLLLLNCTEILEKKQKNPVESLQWRRRPEIADFCPLSWSSLSWAISCRHTSPDLTVRIGAKDGIAKLLFIAICFGLLGPFQTMWLYSLKSSKNSHRIAKIIWDTIASCCKGPVTCRLTRDRRQLSSGIS